MGFGNDAGEAKYMCSWRVISKYLKIGPRPYRGGVGRGRSVNTSVFNDTFINWEAAMTRIVSYNTNPAGEDIISNCDNATFYTGVFCESAVNTILSMLAFNNHFYAGTAGVCKQRISV